MNEAIDWFCIKHDVKSGVKQFPWLKTEVTLEDAARITELYEVSPTKKEDNIRELMQVNRNEYFNEKKKFFLLIKKSVNLNEQKN